MCIQSKSIFLILFIFICVSCQSCKKENTVKMKEIANHKTVNTVLDNNTNEVLVIAHRGDWRNAPENSLQAIENCIDMGVDMVEIDVRLTKDSIPVLMHDKTLDRTTTGEGEIKDWTLEDLRKLYLKNGANHTTHHRIPTLEEALLVSKNQILLNLDKCYNYFDVIYPVLKKTNTTGQVLMKGTASLKEVQRDFGLYLNDVRFMPIVKLDKKDAQQRVTEYINSATPPLAIEFVFSDLTSPVLNEFKSIHESGTRVWVNSLWESLNAGYEDDMAVKHTDSIYGWYLKNNVSMIQTDRPELLLEYLQEKKLHD